MGKACGRNPDMNATEKSDIGVVLKKEPNKMAYSCVMAEVSEERPVTKGNSGKSSATCTRRRG